MDRRQVGIPAQRLAEQRLRVLLILRPGTFLIRESPCGQDRRVELQAFAAWRGIGGGDRRRYGRLERDRNEQGTDGR